MAAKAAYQMVLLLCPRLLRRLLEGLGADGVGEMSSLFLRFSRFFF